MRSFPRPKVVVSKCLEFEACRWNGAMIPSDVVRLLKPHVDFIPVCPEMEVGLGVPRKPIRILSKDGELSLMQHETEKDLTRDMVNFSNRFLGSLDVIDGFILKFRADHHFALAGEFDGVATQVEKNLPQPSWIPAQSRGNRGINEAKQFQAFFRAFL